MIKKAKTILGILAIGFILMTVSCNKPKKDDDEAKKTEQAKGKEYTSVYICPMHCKGSGSDKPGQCPKCGMDYVKNDNHI